MTIPGFGEIAERLRRSTVCIASGNHGAGSGVVWTNDGTIITNAHVVAQDSAKVAVELWDGRKYPATVVVRDRYRDLAKLRIPALDLPAAIAGDSTSLRVGELVVAVGNPLGFIGALTTGVVYALGSIPQVGRWPWVQANLRLAPGNSGGPLADSQGRVVGINTMVFGGLGLAIPSKAVKAFLSNGVSTVTLGVVLRPVVWDRPKRRFGLMILEVQSGTPAERASLLPGDIITGVDGKSVKRIDDLAAALDGTGNRLLRLQFLRAASTVQREVAVDLGPSREKAA